MTESEATTYPVLLVDGPSNVVDAATSSLFEVGCLGTEEVRGSPVQRAYFPPGTNLAAVRAALLERFPSLRLSAAGRLADEDWLRKSQKDWKGCPLGSGFYVVPSWQSPPKTKRRLLIIDPERAFGTGSHETTRLCVSLIEEIAQSRSSLIDAGTGTGILAMVAACLGCNPVLAIDSDPDAVACARKNVARNGLASSVRVVGCDLRRARPARANIVVANLSEPAFDSVLATFREWTNPDGKLILSGLLVVQAQALMEATSGWLKILRFRTEGEWAAFAGEPVTDA